MRDYSYQVTIPANTPLLVPYEADLKLTKGVLQKIWIGFPPGCARMVYIQLALLDTPIMPSNAEQYYAYDGIVFERDCEVDLHAAPYTITIRGYSPSTIYSHTISFIFWVAEDDDKQPNLLARLIG